MTTQVFSNNFKTTLAQDLAPEDTSIYLTTTSGLPVITPNDEFHKVTLKGPLDEQVEVCDVTNVDYNNHILTVVRAAEETNGGQVPLSLKVGDLISLNLTADTLNEYSSVTDDLMERLALIEVNSFDEATESQAGVILILPEADAIAEYNDTYAITPFTLKAIFDNQFDFGVMRQYTESTFVDSINADGTYEISRTNGAMHIINVSPSVTSIDFTFDLNHGEGISVQLVNAETATVTWPVSTVWTNGVPVLDDRVIIEVLNIDSTIYASATNVGIEEEPSGSWDILTASYTGNSFGVGSQETIPIELFFSPDGLNMFILGLHSNNVHHYTLSSAFDITTTTYTGNSFFVGFQGSSTRGLFFSPDGLNMFVVGSTNDSVHQYTLSSAFDITTTTHTGNSFFVGSQETNPTDVFFSPDGFNMFVIGGINDSVHHYTLSSAFDITTTTYTGNSFFVGSQDDASQGLFFSPDGFNMFIAGNNPASVYQYTLT